MTSSSFAAVSELLITQFRVPPEKVAPAARLQSLDLDSLSLMEFVFAVEDRFSLRIPEDQLDPRKADLTLADLCRALDAARAAQAPARA